MFRLSLGWQAGWLNSLTQIEMWWKQQIGCMIAARKAEVTIMVMRGAERPVKSWRKQIFLWTR